MVLTVTNTDLKGPRETEISVRGATIKSIRVTSLVATDIHAHNTFADPRRVEPKEVSAALTGNSLVYSFPPASVTRFIAELA